MATRPPERWVVVGVDGSAAATAAVRWAADDAARRGFGILLLHAVSPFGRQLSAQNRRDANEILDAAAAIVAEVCGGNAPPVSREVQTGHPVDAVVDESKHAAIVVVGFRGHGLLGRHLLGPVSEGVLYHAHCPVVVVRADDQADPAAADAPVLVGVDSVTSERAIALAFEEAQLRGVALVAVYAHSNDTADRADAAVTLANVLSPWRSRYPNVNVEPILTSERPAVELINRSDAAQLVVVGSHGRGGFAGMLLGSVSSDVVRSVDVPVIVARGS